ncbi:hypothetical protein G5I_10039 [Acromyrmex echinatior]|uniref:Uncharacterized protein n=1 Tax=Acromyrmex echinatior TaxID=103372 RepID=F4WVT6_ACREC|nr:hypothetical protein G5I_10039 [Acromyrmex echinatior]
MEIRETILNDLNKCYPGHILEQEVLAVGRIPCNTNAGDSQQYYWAHFCKLLTLRDSIDKNQVDLYLVILGIKKLILFVFPICFILVLELIRSVLQVMGNHPTHQLAMEKYMENSQFTHTLVMKYNTRNVFADKGLKLAETMIHIAENDKLLMDLYLALSKQIHLIKKQCKEKMKEVHPTEMEELN